MQVNWILDTEMDEICITCEFPVLFRLQFLPLLCFIAADLQNFDVLY